MEKSFAEKYPRDEALDALVAAFEAGDYRAVRAGASRMASDADKPEAVREAARDLRSRTEPARIQIVLLAITALLVVVLSGYEIVRHNPGHTRAPPAPSVPSSGAAR